MFFSFTWGFEEERIRKIGENPFATMDFCAYVIAARAASQAAKWCIKRCDAFAGSLLRVQCRFATDYNLVAEIWLGEHRQWTESEKHHAS